MIEIDETDERREARLLSLIWKIAREELARLWQQLR